MEVKPIKNNNDYEKTLKLIDKLWDAEMNSPEGDKLDILVTLVEKYEEKHFKIDVPDPIEAIKFVMEQQNITRPNLEKILGKSRVSEILNKRRKLSLSVIRKLNKTLHIPPEILIKDYKINSYKS